MRIDNLKRYKAVVFFITCVIIIISTLFAVVSDTGLAYASTSEYSDVLSDLTTDSNFNPAEYPVNPDKYSIEVKQIAESTDGELFVYTYQPCQKTTPLTATNVNMSLAESAQNTRLYALTLLNSNGVFCKYKVNGVTVSKDATRYYNITSILRDWIKDIDAPTDGNNIIDEVPFEVKQLWTVTTNGNKITYSVEVSEVVVVQSKWVGHILYPDGYYLFFNKNTACHFVAFSCDRPINELLAATVEYTTRHITAYGKNGSILSTDYGEESDPITKTLYHDKYGSSVHKDWLFGNKTTWKTIQSKEEFLKSEKDNLTDEAKDNLSDKQWVLRFFDTPYTVTHAVDEFSNYYSRTSFDWANKVTILRLKFSYKGDVYDLGVVDNKQTGSPDPVSPITPPDIGFWAYVWRCIVRLFSGTATLAEQVVAIVAILLVVVLLPTLLGILGFAVPAVGKVLLWIVKGVGFFVKYLFLGLWYIISAPFRLIAWLIRRKRNAGGEEIVESQEKEVKTHGKAKRKDDTRTGKCGK